MKIIYFMDILCPWCYAFADNFSKAMDKHRDDFEFEIVPGGMIKEAGLIINPKTEKSLLSGVNYISEKTGVEFGEAYKKMLKDHGKKLSSITSSRALLALKELAADKAFDFAHIIQKNHFIEGIDPSDKEILADEAEKLGVNKKEFLKLLDSALIEKKTNKCFEMVERWQVKLYPSLYAYDEKTGEYKFLIDTKGSFEEIDKIFLDISVNN